MAKRNRSADELLFKRIWNLRSTLHSTVWKRRPDRPRGRWVDQMRLNNYETIT